MSLDEPTEPTEPAARRRWLWWPIPVLLAAPLWWGVGFLPWLAAGRVRTTPYGASTGEVVLPLFAEQLPALVVGVTLGAVVAALPVRLAAPGWRRVLAALLGVVVWAVLAVTLVGGAKDQVGGASLDSFDADSRVVDGLVLAVLLLVAAGAVVGLVVALAPRPVAGILVAGTAMLLPSWLTDLVAPSAALATWPLWAGATTLGLVLAWVGWWGTRAVAWMAGLALGWVTYGVPVAAFYVGSTIRSAGSGPGEILDAIDGGLDVLRASLDPGDRLLGPWVLAVVLGLGLGFLVDRSRGRRAARTPVG